MKKIVIALCAFAAIGAISCSKDKKEAAAPDAQESVQQIEAYWQLNDNHAADPSTALHCRYVLIQNNGGMLVRKQADVKTSGQCAWNDIKGRAADAGAVSADIGAQITSIAMNNIDLAASAQPAWDCAAYNIKTQVRAVGVQDCTIGKRGDAVSGHAAIARQITNLLGL